MDRPSMVAERLSALPEQLGRAFRPRRSWRFVGSVAAALGLGLVFSASLVAGAVLHLDAAPTRRLARQVANRLLGTLFEGRLELGEVRRLGVGGVELASARVYDPRGQLVIDAEGIRAELDLPRLIDTLREPSEGRRTPIVVDIPSVQLARASAWLYRGDDGLPTLATTFLPRDPGPRDPFARAVVVQVADVQIDEARARGDVGVPLDALARRAHASVFVRTDELVSVDVDTVGFTEHRLLDRPISGLADYHLRVRLSDAPQGDAEAPVHMWGSAVGTLAALPYSATLRMDGPVVSAKVELPVIDKSKLAGLLDDLPLARAASGSVWIEGTLPLLHFGGAAEIRQGAGLGSVGFEGSVDLGTGPRLDASIQLSEIDPRSFLEDLPDTRIDAQAALRLEASTPSPRIRLEVQSNATIARGHVIPAIDAVLELEQGAVAVSATVHEAGAGIDTRLRLSGPGDVDFSVVVPFVRMLEAPRIAGLIGGDASARVDGRWSSGELDAKLSGTLAGLRVPLGRGSELGAERATIDGRLRGRPEALIVDASARARNLSARGESWDEVRLSVIGPLERLRVSADVNDELRGAMRARGTLELPKRSLSQIDLSVERGGVRLEGTIAELGFDAAGPRLRGVELSGPELGSLRGSLALRGQELVGSLRAQDVDLERVGRLLALPLDVEGHANIDIALEPAERGRRGHVELELERGRLLALEGVSARLSMGFDGSGVEASGFVRLVERASPEDRAEALSAGLFGGTKLCDGPIVELRFADGRGRLDGPLLSERTWRRATGRVEVDTGYTNLHCVHKKVPFFINPLEVARGLLNLRGSVVRSTPDVAPSLEDLYVRTHGLELVAKGKAWETHRIDAQLRGQVDALREQTRAELLLFDGTILLEADLDARAHLGWLAEADLRERLAQLPFELALHVPRRPFSELSTLPSPLRELIPEISGELRVDAELSGTPSAPYAYLSAQAFGLGPPAQKGSVSGLPPIDLRLGATYEADDEKLAADLDVLHEGVEVAHATAAVEIPVRELLTASPETWTGGLHAELLELPLGAIPALADRDIAGFASGTVSLSGLNRNPELKIDVELPFLALGESFVDGRLRGRITSEAGADTGASGGAGGGVQEPRGAGDLSFDLEGHDGGSIQILAHAGFLWEGRTIPVLDRERRGGLLASADRFRLSALFPFVAGSLSRLDGYLDGKAALEWGRIEQAAAGRVAVADLSVSDAVVFVPQFGQELRGGRLRVSTGVRESAGQTRTVLTADDLEAFGSTGRVHGSVEVELDGLRLTDAKARLQIDPGEAIPVTVEGVPMGNATGVVEVGLRPAPRGVALAVNVPTLRLELPQSSTRNVQSLDELPTVQLSRPLGPPAAKRAADAFEWGIDVDLGDVRLTSAGVDLRVRTREGAPLRLTLADVLRTNGEIVLAGGEVELNKRRFELDRGIVRLREEDAGNPYVNVTAHVDVGDGSRIYVDYVGLLSPITDEKIRFRSDPPRSQAEIVALLLFGETTPAPGTGSVVGSVGGTVATALANELLAQSIFRDVSINLGSTEEGGFVQAAVPLSDSLRIDLSLGAQQQTSARPVGTAGSSAGQTCRDVGLDYRFTRRWSLRAWGGLCNAEAEDVRTSVGVDAVWQYSY